VAQFGNLGLLAERAGVQQLVQPEERGSSPAELTNDTPRPRLVNMGNGMGLKPCRLISSSQSGCEKASLCFLSGMG
jgi:hypothetical protein